MKLWTPPIRRFFVPPHLGVDDGTHPNTGSTGHLVNDVSSGHLVFYRCCCKHTCGNGPICCYSSDARPNNLRFHYQLCYYENTDCTGDIVCPPHTTDAGTFFQINNGNALTDVEWVFNRSGSEKKQCNCWQTAEKHNVKHFVWRFSSTPCATCDPTNDSRSGYDIDIDDDRYITIQWVCPGYPPVHNFTIGYTNTVGDCCDDGPDDTGEYCFRFPVTGACAQQSCCLDELDDVECACLEAFGSTSSHETLDFDCDIEDNYCCSCESDRYADCVESSDGTLSTCTMGTAQFGDNTCGDGNGGDPTQDADCP